MTPENSRRFDHLSKPSELLRPLVVTDVDIQTMKTQLIEAGINLNLTETEQASLAETKFRDLNSGRGIGILASLGNTKATELLAWCQRRSDNGPRLKQASKLTEGSQGRGLRQLAADIIQVLTTPEPTPEDFEIFCLRTNQRVLKGLLWDARGNEEVKVKIHQIFADIPEPESTLSSVPSGSVADLWAFLTTPYTSGI